jgi:predicted nucleic acid-binding protein
MRVFVDTNVFVYLFDADAPDKQQRARTVVSRLAAERRLTLSTQVLGELYVTVTRKLASPLSPTHAQRAVAALSAFPVVPIDTDLVDRAIVRSQVEQMSYWDALILEAAVEAGAEEVYSEDLQPGAPYRDVTVVNPLVDQAPQAT